MQQQQTLRRSKLGSCARDAAVYSCVDRMRWLAATLLSAGLLCSLEVQASDLALHWHAPAGCPDSSELQAGLRTRLGRPITLGPDATTQLDAEVTRDGPAFRLLLITHTESGDEQRVLEARSCNELARATLLVATLLLSTHAAPVSEPAAVGDGPSSGARGALHFTVAGVLDIGRLPAPAPGVSARIGADIARVRLLLGGLYLPAQARAVPSQPGASVSSQLIAAQLGVCYALVVSPWLGPCAYAEVGSLAAQGHGLPQNERSTSLWLLGGLGLALSVPLSNWLDLSTEATLGAPALRPQLSVRDLGRVYQVSVLSGQLQVGLQVRFP